mgnify:CR=1 FL=1
MTNIELNYPFFLTYNNPIQEDILKNWGIETLSNDIDDSVEPLNNFSQLIVTNCVKS